MTAAADTSICTLNSHRLWVVLAGLERGCKGSKVAGWAVCLDLATGHHSARQEGHLLGTFVSAMHHYSAMTLDCLLEYWDPAIENLGNSVDHDLIIKLFANLVALLVDAEFFETVHD